MSALALPLFMRGAGEVGLDIPEVRRPLFIVHAAKVCRTFRCTVDIGCGDNWLHSDNGPEKDVLN